MKILDLIHRRSSIIACLVTTAVLVVVACLAGLAVNRFSRNPLPLKPVPVSGIQQADHQKALSLFHSKTLFVDARARKYYNEGHVPGAVNLDYYNFDRDFLAMAPNRDKNAPLVVYCEGISGPDDMDTCETSRLLARKLFDRGFTQVILFEQGYAYWEKFKYPLEQEGSVSAAAAGAKGKFPPINYARDLVMLLLGIAALFLRKNRPAMTAFQILLGAVFIYSGSTKLFHPDQLAIIIEAYRILPSALVPLAAVCLPWMELAAGLCLAAGLMPSAGALFIIGMHLFFIPALTYRALMLARQFSISIFGVDFDCGCGLGENYAWVLILRDVGFLLLGSTILLSTLKLPRRAGNTPAV